MIAPQMLPSELVVLTKTGWRTNIGDAGSAASPKPWRCASSRPLGMRTVGISAG